MTTESTHSSERTAATGGPATRRSDLDALRSVAMLLGVVLHASMAYFTVPWPVQDQQHSVGLAIAFFAIHSFRMPLFFLLSGFFTMMVLRRRGLASLLTQRALRIGLPLVLAMLCILPVNHVVFDWALRRDLDVLGQCDPLARAIIAEDSPGVARALEGKENLGTLEPRAGLTPLALAASTGNTDIVQVLIDAGADPNGRNRDGGTPLHGACYMGEATVVEQLLACGADATARNSIGQTATDVLNVPASIAAMNRKFLGISPRDFGEMVKGRDEARAAIAEKAADAEQPGLLDQIATRYQSLLMSPTWHAEFGRGGLDLFATDVFDHLWFLWYLCWLVGLMASAELLGLAPTGQFRWWIVCLPCVPQALMWSPLGPDTPFGLLPAPHLLLYYGIFYWFGASTYAAEGTTTRLGRHWRVTVPVGFLVLFPAVLATVGSRPWGMVLQPAFAWMASLGLIGFFDHFFERPSARVRWLADSSYWMYLAHLPLVVAGQSLLTEEAWPAWVKLTVVNVLVVAILLAAYRWGVRYTLVGTLLNGPRTRS